MNKSIQRSIEALIDRGDYEAASSALDAALATSPDAPLLLLAFHVRARQGEIDGAIQAMQSLVALDPELAAPMDELRLCVESERVCALRLADPVLAGKRAAVRPPPMFCLPYVKAAVMRAQGAHDEVMQALREGRAEAPRISGVLTRTTGEAERFMDIADADDPTGPFLPCFDDGSVLDVPYCDLFSIELLPARIALDHVWAPARLVFRDGGELGLRVPALYVGSGRHAEARVRTGESTVWDRRFGYAEGSGQRGLHLTLEGGSSLSVGLRAIGRIDFDAPEGFEAGQKAFKQRMGW